MFSGFMLNAWAAGTIVAVVAGVVGFFTVLRGAAFAAHALPNGAFAGAAAAGLAGVNAVLGLGVFSLLGALTIATLGRRVRQDVATALVIVMMLGLGALFLSMTTEYAPQLFSLLFGEILGVSSAELLPTLALAVVCIAAVLLLYRPLLLSSVLPEAAAARGVSPARVQFAFLVVIALATTTAVPVVGALLIFSLLIAPAAAASSFTSNPAAAMMLSVLIALATVWSALALAYALDLPIGFFVGVLGAIAYGAGRLWAGLRVTRRRAPPADLDAWRPRTLIEPTE
ncbi:MAG: metal ABC transporter permease [Candidatus Dormibacteraeota bacterium]|nr:metal ABC transporter permease [Candidatus Dormibacteraeota bacterium]